MMAVLTEAPLPPENEIEFSWCIFEPARAILTANKNKKAKSEFFMVFQLPNAELGVF